MPLSMARAGEVNKIQRIKGKDEIRRFLETLGFVEGRDVYKRQAFCHVWSIFRI